MSAPVPTSPVPRVPRKAPVNYGDWILRAVFVLLIAGSAWLVYWSLNRLAIQRKQSRELGTLVSRLGNEIQLMQGKYTQSDVEQLGTHYRRANELLFQGQEPLEKWLLDLKQVMIPLALDGTPQLGKTMVQTNTQPQLTILPATLALDLRPAAGIEARQPGYARLLQFLQEVTTQNKRVDLVDLTVTGGTNSIERAVAGLELWAGEEPKPTK
jgi:hypothetical protein